MAENPFNQKQIQFLRKIKVQGLKSFWRFGINTLSWENSGEILTENEGNLLQSILRIDFDNESADMLYINEITLESSIEKGVSDQYLLTPLACQLIFVNHPDEPTLALIADYMNLVCEVHAEGFAYDDHVQTINSYLTQHGYTQAHIAQLWAGEDQLTSS